jgi:hypothetical protein
MLQTKYEIYEIEKWRNGMMLKEVLFLLSRNSHKFAPLSP